MPKIRKPCGTMEEYNRARLEQSILSAGAPPETADRISKKIRAFDGVSVDDIRNSVARELQSEDPRLADAYLRSENLITRISPAVQPGEAEVSSDVVRRAMASPGQKAVLQVGNRATDVSVKPRDVVPPTEIRMSKRDVERLEARDGARVTVSFQP